MEHDDVEAIRLLLDELGSAVRGGRPRALEGLLDREAHAFAPGAPVIAGRTLILTGLQRELLYWQHDLRLHCAEVVVESQWGFCSGTFGLRSVRTDTKVVRYTDGKFVAVVRRGPEERWALYRICYNSNLPDGN